VNEPGFLRAGDHARTDAGLALNRLQERRAVLERSRLIEPAPLALEEVEDVEDIELHLKALALDRR